MPTDTIQAINLGKCYHIYNKPLDRLKQSLWRGRKQFYREFWSVRGIHFSLRHGETLGIIGSNGSGKSTLLQLICGIITPTEGELKIRGRIAALLELGAGFNPEFTGRENVLMNGAILGLSRDEINERFDRIVAYAAIGDFIDQPVKTYSSGMYVRLAFAIAVHVNPEILVIDEALAVGDARFQQKCLATIKNFCKDGTVVFVSHDTSAVTELCTRVIWVESGKIYMEGPPKQVVESYLQYMYEGNREVPEKSIPSKETEEPEISDFVRVDESIRQFGNSRASIKGVQLLCNGKEKGIVYSGLPCEIKLLMETHDDIQNPIAGFLVKDYIGRQILGDNSSFIQKNLPAFQRGRRFLIAFQIQEWPNLQEGDYTLSVAIADGTFEEHSQCHWLHDVIVFKSIPERIPCGILSILNTNIQCQQMSA